MTPKGRTDGRLIVKYYRTNEVLRPVRLSRSYDLLEILESRRNFRSNLLETNIPALYLQ